MDVGPPLASPRGPDPFNGAKGVVERVLRHVQRLQAAAFAGDAAAARRLPAALASLEEQLSALEAAVEQMHRAPGKFGLVSDDIVERRAQVEALRLDASDVARVCEGIGIRAAAGPSGDGGSGGGDDAFSSFQDVDLGGGRRQGADSAKASQYYSDHLDRVKPQPAPGTPPYSFNTRTVGRGGGGGGGGSGGSGGGSGAHGRDQGAPGGAGRPAGGLGGRGDDLEEYVQGQMQRHMMREQDEMLGDIEMHVGRIKHMGLAMHEELEQQSLLLGDLDNQVDASNLRLRGLRKRTRQLIEETKKDRQLQLIAVLCVVLAILIVTAFL